MAIQEPTSAPTSAPASAPASAPTPTPAFAPAPVERASVTENGRYNFRAAAVVGFIVGVVDIFIAARFLGKLFGASSQSAFINFIYQVSAPVVAPFTGIFGNSGSSTNTFETASLVAIVVYAVIGWGLVVLIRIVTAPHGTKPASA
jgi:YGGT family